MRLINLQKVLMLPHGKMFNQTIGYVLSEVVGLSQVPTPNYHARKAMEKLAEMIDNCEGNEMQIKAEEGDFIRKSIQGAGILYPYFLSQLEAAVVEDVVDTLPVDNVQPKQEPAKEEHTEPAV